MDRVLQVLWIVISMFHQIRNLILLQCGVAFLACLGMWFYNPFAQSIHERIESLSPSTSQEIVKLSQQIALSDLLEEKNEETVRAEILSLTKALQWKLYEIHMYPRKAENHRIPVDMRWKTSGDLIKLPIYLEGIRRLSAHGTLESLEISFAENMLEVQLRFYRSDLVYPEWIEQQAVENKKKALLRQLWRISYWQHFALFDQQRKENNPLSKTMFWVELSRQLTLYRGSSQVIEWSRQNGFTDRNF